MDLQRIELRVSKVHCGDFAAPQILGDIETTDERHDGYVDVKRKFLVPIWLEKVIGKRLASPLDNAWAKCSQVDDQNGQAKLGSAS